MSRRASRLFAGVLFSLLFTLVLLEAGARVYFAATIGPRLLMYGTRWYRSGLDMLRDEHGVQTHLNDVGGYREYDPYAVGGYSKFFPNEIRFTPSPDRRGSYPVHINKEGFRGADFTVEKPPDTIRVLALGASSTMGYHDRDDETYPYYLERMLNERAGSGKRFEVINFGIPHATTNNILALFLSEGVRLAPDFVTFYEGANDSVIIERGKPGVADRAWKVLQDRILVADFINYALRLGGQDESYGWSDELAERRSRAFIANVDALYRECRRRGIRLIVATQQLKSELVSPDRMKGLTYDDEVRMVRDMVGRGEIGPRPAPWDLVHPVPALLAVFNSPRVMLIHARVMDALRTWAASHPDVGFVDVIKLLDQDRDLLLNWVHLRAEANHKIAEALAAEVSTELGTAQVAGNAS